MNMKYITDIELGKKIIINNYPEFANSNFEADTKGWDNYVIKVDNEYIFRFPKRDSSFRTIEMEERILAELNKLLPSNIKVSNFIFKNLNEDYPFVGYKMIKGEFLSKELYDRMSLKEKDEFLHNMMSFIKCI